MGTKLQTQSREILHACNVYRCTLLWFLVLQSSQNTSFQVLVTDGASLKSFTQMYKATDTQEGLTSRNNHSPFLGPRGPLVEPSIFPSRPVRPQQFFQSSYIQAYMPYESSEVSSNQPDGTKGSHRCSLDPLGPCRPTP